MTVLAIRIVLIVTGYPSITSVKHNTFIQLPLYFHRQGWIGALRTTVPFDSTGEADHCAALRLIPTSARRVLLRIRLLILLWMSRRTVVLWIGRWTVVLRISISSIIGGRLRLIAGLRRWQRLVSLVAVELIGRLRLAMILSGRILLRRVSLRRVLSSWPHGFDFCFVRVRLESGVLDGFSAV